MRKILRYALIAVGGVLILYSLIMLCTVNFNAGIIMTGLFGAVLALLGIFTRVIPKWLKITAAVCFALVFAFSSFLVLYGVFDSCGYDEDAVVVLGAAVRGETPSNALKSRLDSAADYYFKNESALIVVSGGQGFQEDISEAEAMKRYLLALNVPESHIITEDKSTSTYENFVNSKKILDERLGNDYSVCFVTNEFHVFRAGRIANGAGFRNISHTHGNSEWHTLLPNTLRECLAVIKNLLTGR